MSLLQARAGCDETIEILMLYACRQAGASLRFAAALLCLIASCRSKGAVEVAVHDAASPGAEQPGVLGVLVQAGIRQFRGSRKADTDLLKRDHPSHTKQSPPSRTRRGRRGPLTNTVQGSFSCSMSKHGCYMQVQTEMHLLDLQPKPQSVRFPSRPMLLPRPFLQLNTDNRHCSQECMPHALHFWRSSLINRSASGC